MVRSAWLLVVVLVGCGDDGGSKHIADSVDAACVTYATIEDAGGPSFTKGVCEWKPGTGDSNESSSLLISLAANQVPPSPFVTNTQFSASAGAGVYRGWNVADVDFIASNTFAAIAGCLQTDVPDAANACPTTTCPI